MRSFTWGLSLLVLALPASLVMLPSHAQDEKTPPSIKAGSTHLVIPASRDTATTTLTWDAGADLEQAWLWQKVENETETLLEDRSRGKKELVLLPGKTYTFLLYNRKRDMTLASTKVVVERARPEKPPQTGGPLSRVRVLPPVTRDRGPEVQRRPDVTEAPAARDRTTVLNRAPATEGHRNVDPNRARVLDSAPVVRNPGIDPNRARVLERTGGIVLQKPEISNLQVRPSQSTVVVTFSAPRNTVPLFELGQLAPGKSGERWLFRAGHLGTWPAGGDKARGRYSVDISSLRELTPNTTYYYIISAGQAGQVTGRFTTTAQAVVVRFERIRVLNDSDPNGDGEITFRFFVSPSEGSGKFQSTELETLGDGDTLSVFKELALQNAPDHLTLQVVGLEDDNTLPRGEPGIVTGPFDKDGWEANLAKAAFDLSQYPGKSQKIPFKLTSMPNGGDQGDLSFEVTGYIEITRYGTE